MILRMVIIVRNVFKSSASYVTEIPLARDILMSLIILFRPGNALYSVLPLVDISSRVSLLFFIIAQPQFLTGCPPTSPAS